LQSVARPDVNVVEQYDTQTLRLDRIAVAQSIRTEAREAFAVPGAECGRSIGKNRIIVDASIGIREAQRIEAVAIELAHAVARQWTAAVVVESDRTEYRRRLERTQHAFAGEGGQRQIGAHDDQMLAGKRVRGRDDNVERVCRGWSLFDIRRQRARGAFAKQRDFREGRKPCTQGGELCMRRRLRRMHADAHRCGRSGRCDRLVDAVAVGRYRGERIGVHQGSG
jgi:hypothetical protein